MRPITLPDTTGPATPATPAGGSRATSLQGVITVAAAAAGAHRLEDILEVAAEETLNALSASGVAIGRWDPEADQLTTLVNVGDLRASEERHPVDERYDVGEFPELIHLVTHREAYVVSREDPDISPGLLGLLKRLGRGSAAAVPILLDGAVWGELWASSAPDARPFAAQDLELMHTVAAVLASALARGELFSRLERFAFEDPLTGLSNRRALDDRLAASATGDDRAIQEMTLLICDVDDFKTLNDSLGHEEGDRILRRVAEALLMATGGQPDVLVARVGGDEFCVVLAGRELDAAERIARQASTLLAADNVTLAWGAAASDADTRGHGGLFRRADAAQYTAKRMGAGRICIERPGVVSRPLHSTAGAGRRRHRDSLAPVVGLLSDALGALDSLPPDAPTLDRFEAVASSVGSGLDAAGWSISFSPHGADVMTTVRGLESRLDDVSGARVVDVADDEPYPIEQFPATERALAQSGGFHVHVDDPDGDPAEQAVVATLGYRTALAAAASDGTGSYLLELYGDQNTPPFEEALPALRLLTTQAAARGRADSARLVHVAETDEALRAAEDRFVTAFDNAPIGMALVDPGGRFLQVNRALCRLVGHERQALLATDFQAITHPDDIDADLGHVSAVLSGAIDGYQMDKRYRRSDGEVVWVSLHVSLVRDRSGAPQYFISQLQDICGRKQAEDEVRRRSDHLRELTSAPRSARPGHAEVEADATETGVFALAAALEARDHYTSAHSQGVVELVRGVALHLGLDPLATADAAQVGLLHDVGKVAIPDAVLQKPGPLSDAEWDLMRQHPAIGAQLIESIPGLAHLVPAIRAEHERWDGTGYPDGLSGDGIPLASRIVLACDAWHAMTSDRPYRRALSRDEALAELRSGAGSQFDPGVASALEHLLAQAP